MIDALTGTELSWWADQAGVLDGPRRPAEPPPHKLDIAISGLDGGQ